MIDAWPFAVAALFLLLDEWRMRRNARSGMEYLRTRKPPAPPPARGPQ